MEPPLKWGTTGSPSSTMRPGPRPTSMPSGILIHPAVWPRQTWSENTPTLQTDRTGQDRQTDRQTDDGLIA